MTVQMTRQEEDTRVRMFNKFMTCPHRDTDLIKDVHAELRAKDPVFYAHLACWYQKNGQIRDHNEVFSAMLATDTYLENREIGLALWRDQPVFMKHKILGFVEGKKVKIRTKTGNKIQRGKKKIDEVRIDEKLVGLKQNLPTSFRKERETFLRWLESDPERFDAVALRNFNDLKALYAGGHNGVKPCSRAQKILFEKKYPEDSRLNVFKKVTSASTPEEQAKLIVENKLSYTVAVGLIDKVTPTVLIALVNAMTPQEVVNNIASLEEKGAFDNPDLKAIIDAKLEKATTAKNVATLKSKTAKETGRVKNEEIIKKLDDIADKQVKKAGTIKMSTAIFVDKSGSMTLAIEVGKRVASMVSGAIETSEGGIVKPVPVIAFDTAARPITAEGTTLTAWEKAFKPVIADGGTSIGVALDYLIRMNWGVEQIVIITDEGENNIPFFSSVFPKYLEKFNGSVPRIVVINVPDNAGHISHNFTNNLKTANIEFELYQPEKNDYYGLPGLLMLLSRHSKLDLIYEIMAYPLTKRKPFPTAKTPKLRKIEVETA